MLMCLNQTLQAIVAHDITKKTKQGIASMEK